MVEPQLLGWGFLIFRKIKLFHKKQLTQYNFSLLYTYKPRTKQERRKTMRYRKEDVASLEIGKQYKIKGTWYTLKWVRMTTEKRRKYFFWNASNGFSQGHFEDEICRFVSI